jgi:transposase
MKHIGFDIDCTTTHISVFSDRGREMLHTRVATREEDLVGFLLGISGPKQVAVEESQMADFVTRMITPHVTRVIRCLPQHNRLISESEKKCDREDARSLAELLYLGKLKPVHHAPWDYRQLREGIRSYWTASRDLARTKSRLKAFALFNGVHCTGEKVYARKHRPKLYKEIADRLGNLELLQLLYVHLDCCRKRKAAHIKILRLLAKPFRDDIRVLDSYPGIGFINACTLVAYLENGWRLRNKRKLWQYCGIGIRRHESAGTGRRGATRKGNRYIKNAVMTAAAAIASRRKADNALTRMWRAGVSAGIPPARVKRNVSRKLAVLIHRGLRFKQEYEDARVVTTQ